MPLSFCCCIGQISVDLTPEGLLNRYRILTAIFSYLDLMQKEGIPRSLPPELRVMSDLGWRFQVR